MKPLISIIIPTPKINSYILKEVIPSLTKQKCQNFELIISTPDTKKYLFPKYVKIIKSNKSDNPALARDIAIKSANGTIYAFIDDDCYPSENWTENIIEYINKQNISAICGPGLTPPKNNIFQKVSGYMWASWLGAGGAGTYRCQKESKRYVDDYPTFNLIVKKEDFQKNCGFNSSYWPGEDTKLCHDLVYKLGKKILYHPNIVVFHHRRPIFLPHLKQISRYGFQRGRFTKLFPKTSNKLNYYFPTLFLLGLISIPLIILLFNLSKHLLISQTLTLTYLFILLLYITLLLLTSISVTIKSKNILIGFLLIPTIFFSHLTYGFYFIKGILHTTKK